jgi:hypothetical protein
LIFGELGGEAVEGETVVVQFPAAANLIERLRMPGVQITGVANHGVVIGIQFLSARRLGRGESRNAARVRANGYFGHLHDIDVIAGLLACALGHRLLAGRGFRLCLISAGGCSSNCDESHDAEGSKGLSHGRLLFGGKTHS